jgi:hypothetical protein
VSIACRARRPVVYAGHLVLDTPIAIGSARTLPAE